MDADESDPEADAAAAQIRELAEAELEAPEESSQLCDFCRLPIPEAAVLHEDDGTTYYFCCEACKSAMLEESHVFTSYHGFRRLQPGVSGLQAGLPQGLPRNAFVLLSGEPGTADSALYAELIWRTLQRGEPAVYVTFQQPPGAVVQTFSTLGWNVLPYLEADQLHILDCFTHRMGDRQRMFDRLNRWNKHLYSITENRTIIVRDPTDLTEVENKLDNCLEHLDMSDRGIVVIDSLTEIGSLVQPVQAYNFLKDVRAEVSKGRYVPIFGGATRGEPGDFPHDLEYIVDGVVDLQLTEEVVPETLLKQVRIRKMSGVLTIPRWLIYEYTESEGMVLMRPREVDETEE